MASKERQLQSLLLDSSKFQSFYGECQQHISTKAQHSSCDLQKHLHKLQSHNKQLQLQATKATHKAMRILNETLEDRLAQLNVDNLELREQYKQVVQSVNLRRPRSRPQNSSKVENSEERIREELYEFGNRESLASNKSAQRRVESRPMKENRRMSFRTTRNKESLSNIKKPFMSGKASLNNSFYLKKEEPLVNTDNVFLSMMNLILEEEKIIENSAFGQLAQTPHSILMNEVIDFDRLEKMLKQSYVRIDAILGAVQVYRDNITKIGTEIEGIQTLIREFVQAKNRIAEITNKIRLLPYYKKAIAQAKSVSKGPKKKYNARQMESIKMFLSLFAQDSEGEPILNRIKKIDSDKLLVDTRQGKIKQLVESIRQGRHKFQQICQIYHQRISVLQTKIPQFS